MNDVANDRPEAVQTSAPEARLSAALREAVHALRYCKDAGLFHTIAHPEDEEDEQAAVKVVDAILAADPTIAADLALAAAVRHVGLRFDGDDIRAALTVLGPTGTKAEAVIAVAAQTLAAALDAAKEAERER